MSPLARGTIGNATNQASQDLLEDLQREANIPVDVVTPTINPYANNTTTTNENENLRYVDRVFLGEEIHTEVVIELALEELNKCVPQATYELNQLYPRKLQENKANSAVLAYLQ
eukprot:1342227-Ditylum_brightwellii.AAC.1